MCISLSTLVDIRSTKKLSHPGTGFTAGKSLRLYRNERAVSCSRRSLLWCSYSPFVFPFMSNLKGETKLVLEMQGLAVELRMLLERAS